MIAIPHRPILSLALAALMAGCAAQPYPASDVPVALSPPPGAVHVFTWHAVGTQIYECRTREAASPGWAFIAPEADLFNDRNEKVGVHGAGPHWAAPDGSRINGTVKANSVGQRTGDIPWLLLAATQTGGPGKMAGISSVQRIHTVGGTAPVDGCVAAGDVGKRVKVPYTADYAFFSQK